MLLVSAMMKEHLSVGNGAFALSNAFMAIHVCDMIKTILTHCLSYAIMAEYFRKQMHRLPSLFHEEMMEHIPDNIHTESGCLDCRC